jgi:hypothetical protein
MYFFALCAVLLLSCLSAVYSIAPVAVCLQKYTFFQNNFASSKKVCTFAHDFKRTLGL